MQPPQHYQGDSIVKKQRVSGEEDPPAIPSNRNMLTAPRNAEESMAHADPVTLWQGKPAIML